jgi:ferritin-like metal-binding protein YciE
MPFRAGAHPHRKDKEITMERKKSTSNARGGSSRGNSGQSSSGSRQGGSTRSNGGNGGNGDSFDKLLLDQVKDLYNAEKQLVKALPRIAKEANSTELKNLIQEHLEQTEGHVTRLEQVFEMLDQRPASKTCKGMMGLLEEGKELFEEDLDPNVADAGLIGAAQKVEHYEIAAYGTLIALAEQGGHQEAAQLLQQTLEEEKEADRLLSELAETNINEMAVRE